MDYRETSAEAVSFEACTRTQCCRRARARKTCSERRARTARDSYLVRELQTLSHLYKRLNVFGTFLLPVHPQHLTTHFLCVSFPEFSSPTRPWTRRLYESWTVVGGFAIVERPCSGMEDIRESTLSGSGPYDVGYNLLVQKNSLSRVVDRILFPSGSKCLLVSYLVRVGISRLSLVHRISSF